MFTDRLQAIVVQIQNCGQRWLDAIALLHCHERWAVHWWFQLLEYSNIGHLSFTNFLNKLIWTICLWFSISTRRCSYWRSLANWIDLDVIFERVEMTFEERQQQFWRIPLVSPFNDSVMVFGDGHWTMMNVSLRIQCASTMTSLPSPEWEWRWNQNRNVEQAEKCFSFFSFKWKSGLV